MAYKNKVMARRGCIDLIQSIKDNGSKKYLIKYKGRMIWIGELESIFDPIGNRKVAGLSYTWKFNTKQEAEQVMSIAVLKGLSDTGW